MISSPTPSDQTDVDHPDITSGSRPQVHYVPSIFRGKDVRIALCGKVLYPSRRMPIDGTGVRCEPCVAAKLELDFGNS